MTWAEFRLRCLKTIGFTLFMLGVPFTLSYVLATYVVVDLPASNLVVVYKVIGVLLSPALLMVGWRIMTPKRLLDQERRADEDRLLERADTIRARRAVEGQ